MSATISTLLAKNETVFPFLAANMKKKKNILTIIVHTVHAPSPSAPITTFDLTCLVGIFPVVFVFSCIFSVLFFKIFLAAAVIGILPKNVKILNSLFFKVTLTVVVKELNRNNRFRAETDQWLEIKELGDPCRLSMSFCHCYSVFF
jgi:hypothetical protein